MKTLIALFTFLPIAVFSQSVGIGTATPNASSSLDLGASGRPLLLPRLTTTQMNAIPASNANTGMIIYNTTQGQLYAQMRFRSLPLPPSNTVARWQPISTGPQMIAWGVVDSFSTILSSSNNFSISWNPDNRWYELSIASHPYYSDSMLLIVTPVGNGSWDQAVSTGELIGSLTNRRATIKFTDVTYIVSGRTGINARRRSNFHFVLYNLREEPYQ
ncbi:MAG TPA: hypothetical protein PKD90_04705 [Phnomibacter sp.]|nr:hypothetical protein [Phnomibacter sp.]